MIVLKIVFCIINCIFIKTVFFYQKLYFAAKNVFVFWLKDSVLCINKLYFVSRCICYQKLYLNQNVFCIKNCILPQKCICKKIFSVSKIFGSKSVFCVKNCLLCQKFYFVSKFKKCTGLNCVVFAMFFPLPIHCCMFAGNANSLWHDKWPRRGDFVFLKIALFSEKLTF